MSDEKPNIDPKYYLPSGELTRLEPSAQKAFNGLIALGLGLIAVGLVLCFPTETPYPLFGGIALAITPLSGAALLAGLGRRVPDTRVD